MPQDVLKARSGPPNLELSELIDTIALQAMMNDYYSLTGIGVVIVNLHGTVLVSTGLVDLGTRPRRVAPIPIMIGYTQIGSIFLPDLKWAPGYNEDTIPTALRFYSKLAQMISKSGYDNLVLKNAIADREKAETELRMSKDQYAQTLAAVNTGLWCWQIPSGKTFFNDLFYKLLGYEDREFPATYRYWRGRVHSEDLEKVERNFQRNISSVSDFSVDLRMKARNGDWLWFSISGKTIEVGADGRAIKMVGTLSIITKRKLAEEALRKSEERHRLMFDMSYDALSILEPPSWQFTFANPATIKLFGAHDEAELISQPPWQRSPEQQPDGRYSKEKGREMIEIAMRDGSHFFEWTHRRLSGEDFFSTVMLIRMEINGKQFLQATIRDISKDKKIEQEQIQLKAQLFHTSKLAEIGTFAAGVAHEINNPMALISGYVEIMSESCKNICHKGNLERIHKIQNAVSRIKEIVNGLRTYSRKDTEIIENTDIHLCINETLSLIESIYQTENINLERRLDAHHFLIKANMGKIQQVIMNILGNAKDALSGNPNAVIEISTKNKNDGLYITISDNGPGIPAHLMAHIFEPFFTTKDPGKGTGLGLSICHEIIKTFGGTINVESKLAKGTSFTIFLPIDQNATLESIKLNQVEEEFKISGKALIVDDDEGIRDILGHYLSSFGLSVFEAENGEAAYQKILNEKYDFIFTDMQMPKMDGQELIEKIKSMPSSGDTKVLIITGGIANDSLHKQVKIVKTNPDGYVYKPFQRNDIINSLKLIL